MDEVARSDTGIGALQAVEAQHVQPFIFLVGAHHARGRRSFADDLDHVAFGQLEFRHHRQRNARKPASRVLWPRVGDLNPAFRAVLFGHCHPLSCHCVTR
jgi:hypothetical protein